MVTAYKAGPVCFNLVPYYLALWNILLSEPKWFAWTITFRYRLWFMKGMAWVSCCCCGRSVGAITSLRRVSVCNRAISWQLLLLTREDYYLTADPDTQPGTLMYHARGHNMQTLGLDRSKANFIWKHAINQNDRRSHFNHSLSTPVTQIRCRIGQFSVLALLWCPCVSYCLCRNIVEAGDILNSETIGRRLVDKCIHRSSTRDTHEMPGVISSADTLIALISNWIKHA